MEQAELELAGNIGVCSPAIRGLKDLNIGELNGKSIGGKNVAVHFCVPSIWETLCRGHEQSCTASVCL